jgi:hypothetical protein
MDKKKLFTRKDYLNNKCTHRQYYAQFVNKSVKSTVLNYYSIKRLKEAFEEDNHFNSLPLQKWDTMHSLFAISMKEVGDYLTKSGNVCIHKEAAKQLIEEL